MAMKAWLPEIPIQKFNRAIASMLEFEEMAEAVL